MSEQKTKAKSGRVSRTLNSLVLFLQFLHPKTPFYGYDSGCEYCINLKASKMLGQCKRGRHHNYRNCGEN